MKRMRGFTLIELMVVIAIVGIIMAIAVPAFNEQVRKSRRAEALQGLGSIATQQENWRANHATYGAAAATPGGSGIQMPISDFYTFSITANSATLWRASATPAGAQLGDRCGTYIFEVDNDTRPGQPLKKTQPLDASCD